jgi:hypothetical protein
LALILLTSNGNKIKGRGKRSSSYLIYELINNELVIKSERALLFLEHGIIKEFIKSQTMKFKSLTTLAMAVFS